MEKAIHTASAILGGLIALSFAGMFLLIGAMTLTAGFAFAPFGCVVVSVVVAYHAVTGTVEQIKLN